MDGFAEQKVPEGKLVGVRLRYGKTIEKVLITGDFFVHPENAVYRIETALEGMPSNSKAGAIAERIAEVVKAEGAELIGVTPEAIADTILKAMTE